MDRNTIIGYGLSMTIFVISMVALYGTAQSNMAWLPLMLFSCAIATVVAVVSLKKQKKRFLTYVGLAAVALVVVGALDMYDEIVKRGGGNGFLLDGLAAIMYVYILPICFSLGIITLAANVWKNQKGQKRKRVLHE